MIYYLQCCHYQVSHIVQERYIWIEFWDYLDHLKNREFVFDSRYPIWVGRVDALDKYHTNLFAYLYPDVAEGINTKTPDENIYELDINIFLESGHLHDKRTHRSITGFLIKVSRNTLIFITKQQKSIEMNIYGVDFCTMRILVEEVQSVGYIFCCLVVKVKYASLLCGDNRGVIQNSTIFYSSLLKKKHVSIAHHRTR